MSIPVDLKEQTEAWIAADPDPETRAELEQLLAADSAAELQSRFGSTLKFGTAGLRGELGAGPNRMNRVVVRQTTAALVDYLNELAEAANAEATNAEPVNAGAANAGSANDEPVKGKPANTKPAKIAIGYDGRRNSDVFARDAAAVAAAKGGQAILLEGVVPTPVLAHAVLRHGCDAGVMITASHNPPQDNGYKVYWHDGAQIIPPHDRKIEHARHQIGLLPQDYGYDIASSAGRTDTLAPTSERGQNDVSADASFCQVISSAEEIEKYAQAAAAQIKSLFEVSPVEFGTPDASADEMASDSPHLQVVYTPLHGVGKATLLRLFEKLEMPEPIVVPEQAEPDGDFPTVQFPNPEEPGALDLALRLAAEEDADVVLANDPDADRLCVAINSAEFVISTSSATSPVAEHADSLAVSNTTYRVLSGDELGCLLADGILSFLGKGSEEAKLLVGTTIVSSQLLAKIAEAHGAAFSETLTGFKWLARVGDNMPERFVFGYEEALGFSVLPDLVRDKDGITAAAVFMLLMRQWKAEGASPLDRLGDLYRQHGLHKSRQISFRYEGDNAQATMAAMMGSLRMSPPTSFAASDASTRPSPPAQAAGMSPPTSFAASDAIPDSPPRSPPETADSPPPPSPENSSSSTEEANESTSQASGKESNAVSSIVDYAEGTASSVPANVLMYFLRSGARVIIRPSGTEPKLKAYLEVIEPVGNSGNPNAAIADAADLATAQLNQLEAAVRSLIDERSKG